MNEFYNKLKYFEETEKVPKEVYYHYTSLEALYEIVRSHTFRLMSLKSSNDRTELFYRPESFLTDLANICEDEKEEKLKLFFCAMKKSLDEHSVFFSSYVKAKRQPYALCLSAKRDNLTHWDRYANNCQGVCIGFNVAALKVYYKRMNSEAFGESYFDIGKTLYSQDDIETTIKRGMLQSVNMLKEIQKFSPDSSMSEIISESGYIPLCVLCVNIMRFAKNASFVDEDEIRLYHDATTIKETLQLIDSLKGEVEDVLYQNTRKNFLEIARDFKIKDENFAMTRSGIRSYRTLCLDEIWGSGVIPEIILGPMCVQNKNELQRFLKCNGLEGTKIKVSSVPIR
jgi:hypothetical protein